MAFANRGLWKATKSVAETAKRSADAAELTARGLSDTERARFHTVICDSNFRQIVAAAQMYDDSPEMQAPFAAEVKILFKNYGRTPGVVREISFGEIVLSDNFLRPVYTGVLLPQEQMVAAGDSTSSIVHSMNRILTHEEVYRVTKEHCSIWVVGRIDYSDVFNLFHTHRFVYRFFKYYNEFQFQSFDFEHYNQST
ncbi:MAG: hypothetical protein WEC00_08855 [Dongiaceae bacterium]